MPIGKSGSIWQPNIWMAVLVCAVSSHAEAGDGPSPGGNDDPPAPKVIEGVPPGFEVVRLTETDMLMTVPDINDQGEVVWAQWSQENDELIGDVYRYADGVIMRTTLSDTFDFWPTTNNASELAWSQLTETGDFELSVDYLPPPNGVQGDFSPSGSIDMNDQGDVVWKHFAGANDDNYEIFLYSRTEGLVRQITNNGFSNQIPRINEHGDIVWTRYDFSVNPWQGTIMLYSDGEIVELTNGQSQDQSPDINDSGNIVWAHGSDGVMLWQGGVSSMLIKDARTPRIANSGDVFALKWDEPLERWKQILSRDGTIYELPQFDTSAAVGDVNIYGEAAWRALHENDPYADVLLLRQIAPPGDFNHDCHIDMIDFRAFQICASRATDVLQSELHGDCTRGDMDGDGVLDSGDFTIFVERVTGPTSSVQACNP